MKINLELIKQEEGKISVKDFILDEGVGINYGNEQRLLSYLTKYKTIKKRLIIEPSRKKDS